MALLSAQFSENVRLFSDDETSSFSFAELLNVFIFHPEDYVFSDSKQEASNLEVSIWLTYVQGVTILINSDTPNADTTKNLLGRIYAVCVYDSILSQSFLFLLTLI